MEAVNIKNIGLKKPTSNKRENFLGKFIRIIKKDRQILLLLLPGLLYYLIFHYGPMYGVLIAFKKYSVAKGILGSDWVGLKHFISFFTGFDAFKIIRNTLMLSVYNLVLGFPAPIFFALLLNEIRSEKFKRLTQTISYLPHFISTVVVCGLVANFLQPESGVINIVLNKLFGIPHIPYLMEPQYFRGVYVGMHIWKEFGWGAIIYLAALTNVDVELYEAAKIDGANRFQQVLFITIPCLLPVAVILLILRLGHILNTGFESIILLYTPLTYETADVIDTYVYRRGLIEANYSFGAAVGLFKSVIALILVVTSNKLSKKLTDTSLW